tara:strand:- start:908 stop:1090 length:183 start_codon:yes stop_codon:yes gene_type:complete
MIKDTVIEQQLVKLSSEEQRRLAEMANDAGMTVMEFIEYSQKAQIYKNAAERLRLKADAA